MDKSTGTKRTQKGILRGKACTKEWFCNDSTLYGFSRAWALRNGIAGEIRLAIGFCSRSYDPVLGVYTGRRMAQPETDRRPLRL